jgi:hypothetical protein
MFQSMHAHTQEKIGNQVKEKKLVRHSNSTRTIQIQHSQEEKTAKSTTSSYVACPAPSRRCQPFPTSVALGPFMYCSCMDIHLLGDDGVTIMIAPILVVFLDLRRAYGIYLGRYLRPFSNACQAGMDSVVMRTRLWWVIVK